MQTVGIHKRWKWPKLDSETVSASQGLASQLGVAPLVAGLLMQRGITDPSLAESFLRPRLTDLHDPASMPGVVRAADRIGQAVQQRQPIVIYGDYDVDGITASAILWHVLRLAGAQASVYVPHRIDEGYGLNSQAITELAKHQPLIVTVDCGITAVEPARVAKQVGVDLIITDHHACDSHDQALPEAYALVHPRLAGSKYPFGELCGAGVAFKLAWQVAKQHCGGERLPDAFRSLLLDLLSYVALGTVADVVPLVDENRVLTVHGLGQIKRTRFVGLNALIDASRLRDEKIDAYHVGFVLGPRLNACGRMGHAEKAVKLLTMDDPDEARRIAVFLTQQNDRRRSVERSMLDEAKQMVVQAGYDREDHRAIVLGKPGWHAGVVGIVASRLAEQFARPVVMLSYPEDGGGGKNEAHGSARSVEGVSIYDAIDHCSEMLSSFGGHAMAAGLRMRVDRIEAFRQRLVAFVNQRLGPKDLVATLTIDAVCSLDQVTPGIFDQIDRLAPFGRGNPSPVLCVQGVTNDRPTRRVGNQGQHLQLMLRQGDRLTGAVWFGMGGLADRLAAGVELDVVFTPKVSVWQNRTRAEMHLKDVRILAAKSCRTSNQ